MKPSSVPNAAAADWHDELQPALFDTTTLQTPRPLPPGTPWPDPEPPRMPGSPDWCGHRKPGGDPIYERCDRALAHDGPHADVRFSDGPERHLVGRSWTAEAHRTSWLRYRQQTQPLLDQRNATHLAAEQADDEQTFEDALAAAAEHSPIPTFEQWTLLHAPQPLPHSIELT